jgi:hypothetical protein
MVQQPPTTKAAAVSTTSTGEYLADQLALSRLDDDDAPLGPQAPADATTLAEAPVNGERLSLVPSTALHAGLGGGWWPRSRDATAELPGLINELSTRVGRVSRVALQVDAFDNIPHKLAAGGRKVHVAWRTSSPVTALPRIMRWISDVPSKMVEIFEPRCQRSTGNDLA